MSFDKKRYWENRNHTIKQKDEDGNEVEVAAPKRGQGPVPKGRIINTEETMLSFTNEGEIVVKNRAYRRQKVKLPTPKKKVKRKKKKK